MKTYDVVVTRDQDWWAVAVPELDGITQARSLEGTTAAAREYIAVTLDVAPDSFDVRVT
ncbi:hypothetical protein ACFVSU_02605 [Microbacterium sp. NPDC058062]|uniref:hypothetical protein n=1 Tax=Microbacterium sp. NPDC058062 TaxID=3346320 RepID=UPI0036DC5932